MLLFWVLKVLSILLILLLIPLGVNCLTLMMQLRLLARISISGCVISVVIFLSVLLAGKEFVMLDRIIKVLVIIILISAISVLFGAFLSGFLAGGCMPFPAI